MRVKHELSRGVVCEKCEKEVKDGKYKRINALVRKENDTTGMFKTIDRFNLCDKCYEKFVEEIEVWLNSY